MNPVVYWPSRALAWLYMKVAHRARFEGSGHVPASGPALLVANHASFLDPPLLGLASRRPCQFLARSSLGHLRPASWWLGNVGTILIDRDAPSHRVFEVLIEHLQRGELVTVFPEGTRSRDGRLAPFKRGLQLLVKRTGAPVVPAGIRGTFAAWPRHRRFPNPLRAVGVRVGAPFAAEEILAAGGLERLRVRIAELAGIGLQDRPESECDGDR